MTCANWKPPSDSRRKDAIAYFVSRIRREIGGLAATIGGLDAIVFTGGIGENSARIREAVLSDMDWIGIDIDRDANTAGERVISAKGSPVVVFVIKTDEERMIAEHTGRDSRGRSSLRRTRARNAQSVGECLRQDEDFLRRPQRNISASSNRRNAMIPTFSPRNVANAASTERCVDRRRAQMQQLMSCYAAPHRRRSREIAWRAGCKRSRMSERCRRASSRRFGAERRIAAADFRQTASEYMRRTRRSATC